MPGLVLRSNRGRACRDARASWARPEAWGEARPLNRPLAPCPRLGASSRKVSLPSRLAAPIAFRHASEPQGCAYQDVDYPMAASVDGPLDTLAETASGWLGCGAPLRARVLLPLLDRGDPWWISSRSNGGRVRRGAVRGPSGNRYRQDLRALFPAGSAPWALGERVFVGLAARLLVSVSHTNFAALGRARTGSPVLAVDLDLVANLDAALIRLGGLIANKVRAIESRGAGPGVFSTRATENRPWTSVIRRTALGRSGFQVLRASPGREYR